MGQVEGISSNHVEVEVLVIVGVAAVVADTCMY
jgi:hypothetical protein